MTSFADHFEQRSKELGLDWRRKDDPEPEPEPQVPVVCTAKPDGTLRSALEVLARMYNGSV